MFILVMYSARYWSDISRWTLRGLFKYGDGGDGAIVKKARQTGRQPLMSLSSTAAEHVDCRCGMRVYNVCNYIPRTQIDPSALQFKPWFEGLTDLLK